MALNNSSNFDFRDISIYLNEYSRKVDYLVEDTIYKVAKEAAKRLKNDESTPRKTGKYAKGWAAKQDKKNYSRIGVKHAIVYGKDGTYQLAHLLEHGHATRSGKRTKPIEHIAKAERWAVNEAYDRIMHELEAAP